MDINTQMGAQINIKQMKKILQYVEIGIKEGAKLACGENNSPKMGVTKVHI